MKGVLIRAIDSKEKIEMIYITDKGVLSQRFITVLNVNDTHLICYCHTKKQRRMFKLTNILSAAVPLHRHA